MKLISLFILLISFSVKADPLKKVLKRSDYCSPLQKIIGSCGKKAKDSGESDESEDKSKIKKARKKAEEKEEEETEEFLR
ncbi:MAG: hypothetical protein ACJAT2_000653 [Bacteriovoracaceae bacterium]|jgi:hypothetical protein